MVANSDSDWNGNYEIKQAVTVILMLRWYTYCEWIGSLDYNGEDIERGPGDKEDSREEG